MTETKATTRETWLDRWIRQKAAGRAKRQSDIHDLIGVVRTASHIADGSEPPFCRGYAQHLPALPLDIEAAAYAREMLAEKRPDLAARLTAGQIADLLATWRIRHDNRGRRGKGGRTFDDELAKLAKAIGIAAMSAAAVRKLRARDIAPP